jgi:glycosyltransferase involved in cell wall biosynthesis
MKILHIISSGGMYGAEAVILNLSRVLNRGEHRSIVGVFANSANENVQLHERSVVEGIESYLIPCKGQIDLAVPGRIRDLVSSTGADVIHAHGYKADIYVALAMRDLPFPIVSTCHTWYDNSLLLSLYGMVDRLALRRFTSVVAVSAEVRGQLLNAGVSREKVHLVSNGIDLRPFEGAQPSLIYDGLLVGLVGRLSQEKGVDLFVQAASVVLREIPTAHFVVLGEGPDHAKLRALIHETGVEASFELLGRHDDMASVYASFDVMVSASRQEGLPMAMLEGMASERAIVATSVGEVPSLIQNERTGLLVAPNDAQALATAIVSLLRDEERRRLLGAAAKAHVKNKFSAERMAYDYLCIYSDALASFHSITNAAQHAGVKS